MNIEIINSMSKMKIIPKNNNLLLVSSNNNLLIVLFPVRDSLIIFLLKFISVKLEKIALNLLQFKFLLKLNKNCF